MKRTVFWLILLLALVATGCSDRKDPPSAAPPAASARATPAPDKTDEGSDDDVPAAQSSVPPELRLFVQRSFTGDFDEMVKRRVIRIGVPYNRTFYFVDHGVQRGLSYEYLKIYEDELNEKRKTGNMKIDVVPIPLRRDALLSALTSGKVDIVVAQLTITPDRQAVVDFTNPTRSDVSEVIVTGPESPAIATVDDLSGKSVFVRKSSSYYNSLTALNDRFKKEGKPPVDVEIADESLEDDDLLEMVNAGLIPVTVVDNYFVEFWKKVFTDLNVHSDVALRTGGQLAAAVRKNSPKLLTELNAFAAKFGWDSAIGRMLNARYLQNTKYAKNARSEAERKKFQSMATLFKRYGDRYQFDYLMMAAQGFQESGLDQNARSHVGAIGVMQLMPATGKEQKVGDITTLEPNIHAGVKYMRFVRDQYYKDEPMTDVDKALFTFASYNAGAGRIRQLRRETERRGLNPNLWFGNVEQIASERIGRETVTYVSNIFKYYLAYRLIQDETVRRREAKAALTSRAK